MASIEEAKLLIKEAPISSIIGYYIPVSKKGANYESICPFHNDTKPSLKINDQKGLFKCFACDASGDAIKFVMDRENLEFVDAVKEISAKMGITIEEKQYKKNPKFDLGFRLMSSACKLYQKVASEQAPRAFVDFVAKRNLSSESIENFALGFSPKNNALLNYIKTIPESDREKALSLALETGIIREGSRGQYDFFRGRVMFPICDAQGKVRAFSSRATSDEQQPKYLHSQDSFMFNKSNLLFGFHLAKNHIRKSDSVIIAEGNMDVIMLHQYGFQNSVASLGTALTEHNVSLLSNITKNIYLAMDSDTAGVKAMKRINTLFMNHRLFPKYISFAPAKDPDEFLNRFGRLELKKKIEEARSVLDFMIEDVLPEKRPENIELKLKYLDDVFEILMPLKSDLMAKEKAIEAAKTLGMKSSEDDIITAYEEFLTKHKRPDPPKFSPKKEELLEIETHAAKPQKEATELQENEVRPLKSYEKVFITQIIKFPTLLEQSTLGETLDLMTHNEVKRLVQWLQAIYFEIDEDEYASVISQKVSDSSFSAETTNLVSSTLYNFEKQTLEDETLKKLMEDLGIKIKQAQLREKRDLLKEKQKVASSNDEAFAIISEIQEIQQQLNDLKARA
jgi:DNA primase